MKQATPAAGVPKILYVLIIVILAAMYYYAAYVEVSEPEKVVQDFYQAYFDKDYAAAAENMSVFWSVQFLPDYSTLEPQQLLEKRPEIVAEVTRVITELQGGNQVPDNISLQMMPEYIHTRPHSAMVAYTFMQDNKPSGMEVALLIKEAGRFRIISLNPINEQALETISDEDLDALEESFINLAGE